MEVCLDLQTERARPRGLRPWGRSASGGQVLVIGVIVILALSMMAITVANVGILVAEKVALQDTVDAAAYSAAVAEARYLNLTSYVNRALVANYDAMAANTALWSTVASFDHGLATTTGIVWLAAGIIQIIPPAGQALDNLGAALNQVHNVFHEMNDVLDQQFAQDQNDLNGIIETYNTDVLSSYAGLLYAVTQASRHRVAQEVARKMDKEVKITTVLGLGAETLSGEELTRTIDWVIQDPDSRGVLGEFNEIINNIAGIAPDSDDNIYLLGALAESSLDKFAAGRFRDGSKDGLRNFGTGNMFGSFSPAVKTAMDVAYVAGCAATCAATLGLSGCDCDSNVGISIGSRQRWTEEDFINQGRVPIIARRRMREVNYWGIDFELPGVSYFISTNNLGYTSAERHADIRNIANLLNVGPRALQCLIPNACGYNKLNVELSQLTGSIAGILGPGDSLVDDHWDGTFDAKPVCGLRYFLAQNVACFPTDVKDYILEITAGEGFEMGVPKYDWKVELPQVGFSRFHYPLELFDTRALGNTRSEASNPGPYDNTLIGPSIAVVGVKNQEDVNGLRGLGIGNEYSLTAMSRAQVYYLRNPERPNERPSVFNPHWVARLAPIDSDGAPELLRYVLPYIGGFGVPVQPTH